MPRPNRQAAKDEFLKGMKVLYQIRDDYLHTCHSLMEEANGQFEELLQDEIEWVEKEI